MVEIERKFLVRDIDFIKLAKNQQNIKQGYLNSHPERTVRIRIKDDRGFITIKGKSNETGTSRFEWEKEIPLTEALALFALCEAHSIEKTRYEVAIANHLFEVDVFHGKNQGLIIAEIELETENQYFDKPEWLGSEVTGDKRYYNAYLSNHPFLYW